MHQPHNLPAERALLGQVLQQPALLRGELAWFEAAWLWHDEHRRLWTVLGQLLHEGHTIDLVTLPRLLDARGGRWDLGYLTELPSYAPTTANATHYAETIRDDAVRRLVISEAEALIRAAHSGQPVDDLRAGVVDTMHAIMGAGQGGGAAKPLADYTEGVLDRAEAAARAQDDPEGNIRDVDVISTGSEHLDRVTGGGAARGNLIVIGGRPGMGKTALGLAMAEWAATEAMHHQPRESVLVISLEMTGAELGQRSLASQSDVPHHAIRTGQLSDSAWASLINAQEGLRNLPILIWARTGQTIGRIIGAIHATAAKHPLRMVVIDYTQLIRVVAAERRDLALGDAVAAIKGACADVGAVGVLLSQFNRSKIAANAGVPCLEALKDTGGLEEHADMVIGVDRPGARGEAIGAHWMHVYGLKTRHGPHFVLEAAFRGDRMQIQITGDLIRDGDPLGAPPPDGAPPHPGW